MRFIIFIVSTLLTALAGVQIKNILARILG